MGDGEEDVHQEREEVVGMVELDGEFLLENLEDGERARKVGVHAIGRREFGEVLHEGLDQ